jgi:hypothetical protein
MICISRGRPVSRLSVHSAAKNPRAAWGVVNTIRAGDLDLAHGDVPPVARGPIRVGQRQWQPRPPAFAEHPDRPRPKAIADLLQTGGVVGGGKAVVQLREPDACRCGGPLRILVTVSQILIG